MAPKVCRHLQAPRSPSGSQTPRRAGCCSWPSSSLVPEAHGGIITASLQISGTAYLCPFHSSHEAEWNSSQCPLFPSIPESDETWLSVNEGTSSQKARWFYKQALQRAASSEFDTPLQSAGVRGPPPPRDAPMRWAHAGIRQRRGPDTRCQRQRRCSFSACHTFKGRRRKKLPPASAEQETTSQVGFHLPWAGTTPHGRKPLMITQSRAEKGDWVCCICCLLMQL